MSEHIEPAFAVYACNGEGLGVRRLCRTFLQADAASRALHAAGYGKVFVIDRTVLTGGSAVLHWPPS